MAASTRRTRPTGRRGPVFDLRLTALGFGLAAIVLFGAGLAGRVVFEAAQRHPAAAVAAALIGAPAVVAALRGGRRVRAARAARRATAVLTEAAETVLEEAAPERTAPPGAGPVARTAPADRAAGADPPDGTAPAAGVDPVDDTVRADAVGAVDAVDAVDYDAVDYDAMDYDAMDAEQFEQAVAALCERDGCEDVQVVGGAGDLGADVVATAPDGRRVVIQCKRYRDTNKVGSQDVQRFGGTCWTVHGARVAAVVTTSDFTEPAAGYAERCGILCVGRQALAAWSEGTGPAPWDVPGPDPGTGATGAGPVPVDG